ncbi:MAG: MATE family efflux transporter [Microbacteriaceae bacterium]
MANPLDREILTLAVPTLGALVAEPLFILVDTALVGHLGDTALAGLGIASVLLQTAVGLLVFLAYATTPAVARLLGAGNRAGALRAGIDGLWLALAVGAVLLVAGLLGGPTAVAAFGGSASITDAATTYLSISVLGLPAMLLVLAGTGLMRGLHDVRTPFVIVSVGFAANAALNVVFIYGLGWGIAGSALGTVVAQWGMAVWFVAHIVRRAEGVPLRPRLAGFSVAAASGGWLFARTISLRIAILLTFAAATQQGVTELAALQVGIALYSLLAFVLDSLAIAGQTMIGHGLGIGDRHRVRAISGRLIRFGVLAGIALGVLLAALAPVLGALFTSDEAVREQLVVVVLILAIALPISGFVFVLDGVLIGAGDGRYLALSGIVNVVGYLPLLLIGLSNFTALWITFCVGYLGLRALTLGLRVRGSAWLRH